jgi:dolichyl-phosphate-mannose--protein O-mannosyl transferase
LLASIYFFIYLAGSFVGGILLAPVLALLRVSGERLTGIYVAVFSLGTMLLYGFVWLPHVRFSGVGEKLAIALGYID